MDKLYYNGTIHSIDKDDNIYSAIGIEGGKIAFLGTDEEAQRIRAAERINLKGVCVLPGFIDSHLHLLNYAFVAASYRMFDAVSVKDIIEAGRRRLALMDEADETKTRWLFGRGWNHQNFSDEKRMLTRQDLDQISTTRPILFIRVCGHAAAVNTKGLEIIMKLPQTAAYRNQIDEEKGILTEASVKLCYNAMDAPSTGQIKDMILTAQKDFNQKGITSVQSDNFLSLPGRDRRGIINAHRELEEEGKLTLRIREQASFTCYSDMKAFIDEGWRTGQGGQFYSIGPIKLYEDGSLGAKTALLHKPYCNQPDSCGLMVHDEEDLQNCVDYAYSHDMQILIHSIGDRSSDMVCTAYENAIGKYGKKSSRLAINHLQIVSPDLFDRMKKNDILAYIQPVFVASDKGTIREFIGEERERYSYCWKTMLEKGLHCCGSSDSPVEDYDVLKGIQVAVTREGLAERGRGWYPEERLSVREAVRLFTIDNAYGAFEEEVKGSLEIGKLADLVVLGEDIFQTDIHRIAEIPVLRTIVGGKEVWKAQTGLR